MNFQRLTLKQKARSLQLDQTALVLAVTCGLPLLVHAVPMTGGPGLGVFLLPIFYAPLLAVLLCRPHVAMTSALLAPTINRLLTGQPDLFTAKMLTTELVIFVVLARIISARRPRFWGTGVVSYLSASFISKVLLGAGAFYYGEPIGMGLFVSRAVSAFPGLVILLALNLFGVRMAGEKR